MTEPRALRAARESQSSANVARPLFVLFAPFVLVACTVALFAPACGLRTPVRPPEDTAPVIPGAATATRGEDGVVVVHWKRAEQSADGMRLDDLVAFVVERKRTGEDWQRIAIIDVVDQEKIRRRRDFSHRDAEAGSGDVSYRVFAVNADGQEGPPTGVVTAIVPEAGSAAE